jgi:transposase-like protein
MLLANDTDKELQCPACGHGQHYLLADNRLQCAACRKKFTPVRSGCRLTDEELRGIATAFREFTPVAAAADRLGINPKTVLRYYNLLRIVISRQTSAANGGEQTVSQGAFARSGLTKGMVAEYVPLFGLKAVDNGIKVMAMSLGGAEQELPETESVHGWICVRGVATPEQVNLDSITCLFPAEDESVRRCRDFWAFARKGLRRYQAGVSKNLPLYLREMEFRFNSEDITDRLIEYLRAACGFHEMGENHV